MWPTDHFLIHNENKLIPTWILLIVDTNLYLFSYVPWLRGESILCDWINYAFGGPEKANLSSMPLQPGQREVSQ